MTGPNEWDDARTTAAFVARASRIAPLPATTTRSIIDGLDRRRVSPPTAWRFAAAVLAVGVAAVSLVVARPGNPASAPDDEFTATGPVVVGGPIARPSAPIPRTICPRLLPKECEAAIEVVRASHPAAVMMAWAIVVDDTCPPDRRVPGSMEVVTTICDRFYPFDSLVILVPPPDSRDEPVPFHVVGSGTEPKHIVPWAGSIPAPFLDLIAAARRPSPAPQSGGAP